MKTKRERKKEMMGAARPDDAVDDDADPRVGGGEDGPANQSSSGSSSSGSSSDDDTSDSSSDDDASDGGGGGEGVDGDDDGGGGERRRGRDDPPSSRSSSLVSDDARDRSTVDVGDEGGEGGGRGKRVVPLSDDSDSSDSDSDLDDDEGEDDDGRGDKARSEGASSTIKINQKYAREYNLRKGREELARYDSRKTKSSRVSFADDVDGSGSSSSSSSSEDEDEMGELLTPELDLKIVRTIRALRKRDERVYDPNVDFFTGGGDGDDKGHGDDDNDDNAGDNDGNPKNATKTGGKKRIKDVIREQILERIDADDDDGGDDEGADADVRGRRGGGGHRLAYDAEQEMIRGEFLRSTADGGENNDDDGEDNGEDDGLLLVKKSKRGEGTRNERAKAAEKALRREMETLEREAENGGLRGDDHDDSVVDPHGEVKDGEKFLRDFVLNRRWIDKTVEATEGGLARDDFASDDDAEDGPLTKKEEGGGADDSDEREVDETSSLEDLDRMDAFESKYNFRFEEAEAEGPATIEDRYRIVGYARGTTAAAGDSLRRPDETRKQKRAKRKERKLAERRAKEEQLRRLKNARMEAMREKLERVRQVSGMVTSAGSTDGTEGNQPRLSEEELAQLLEGDYDPEKFSKIMEGALYGEEYYQRGDSEWRSDADVRDSMLRDATALSVDRDEYGAAYDEYGYPDNQGNGDEDHDHNADHGDHEFDYGGRGGNRDELQQQDEDSLFLHGDDEEATRDKRERPESEIEKQVKAKMLDELYKLDYEDLIGDMPCRFKYRKVEPNSYGLSCEEILFANDSTLKGFVSLKKMSAYRDEGEHRVGSKKRKRFRQALKADYEKHLENSNEMENAFNHSNKEAESKEDSCRESIPSSKKKRRRRQKKGKGKTDSGSCLAKPQHDHPEMANESCLASAQQSGAGQFNTEGDQKRKRKKKGKKKSKTTAESDASQVANAEKKVDSENGEGGECGRPSINDTKRKRKRNKSVAHKNADFAGVSASRLASYGL